jgi:excisionase family DNA binding protein
MKNNTEEKEFLSRTEAGEFLGVHAHSIDSYANQGLFPRYKIGRHVRFRKSEIIDAIKRVK